MADQSERVGQESVAANKDGGDARLTFIYQEAVRGLNHQQNLVENMNSRAGSLIFATAFANSLLGSRALSDGLGIWEWIAAALLFAIGALIVFMLWPFHRYSFRFDPEELLAQFIDGSPETTLSDMHRALALRIKADMADNWRIIRRLRVALQLALIFLLLDILAWFMAIAGA